MSSLERIGPDRRISGRWGYISNFEGTAGAGGVLFGKPVRRKPWWLGGGAKRRRIWTMVPTGKARSCRRRRPALAEKPGIDGFGRFGGKAGNR